MNYATPQTPVSSVSVPFTGAQSAGNLSVVVVGWNDTTARVVSVTDTKGNAYQLAVGPTTVAGALTQSIHYAMNIAAAAAGANTVKVSFTVAANYPDIRILEYGGLGLAQPGGCHRLGHGQHATSAARPSGSRTVSRQHVATWTTDAGADGRSRGSRAPTGDIAEIESSRSTGSYAPARRTRGCGCRDSSRRR